MYINNIAKKKDLFHKPFFFFSRWGVLCTYPVIASFVHLCIYFEWFSPVAIFRTGFSFVEYFLEVPGPFYNLITRTYATNFNMNFLEVFILL